MPKARAEARWRRKLRRMSRSAQSWWHKEMKLREANRRGKG